MKVCTVCRARFRGEPVRCPLDGGDLVDLPDPLIGRTIGGRYVITKKIGSGGMGTVYRANQEVVGRDVAIKFLSPDLAMDPTNRERFLREARAANRINHEHIIDITDFGDTDDGLVYLVMEYLKGRPLNEEIALGAMAPARALTIGLQMAQALARAHELDVVHRDIKPDNVYLLSGYDGDFVKILDFGLAQMKGELKLTATGTVFGTPEYMAPEQARGAQATFAVDLYAVGIVLFEMLTGDLPFTGNTPDLIIKHMREKPPAPSQLRSGLPLAVDELVVKLLEKKPEDRHHDAHALADELKQLLTDLGAPAGGRPKSVGEQSLVPGRLFVKSGLPPEDADEDIPPTETFQVASGAGRRSSQTQPSDGPPLMTQTMVTEAAWEERVALFRKLVAQAHPRGDAPPWLTQRIDELASRVAQLKDVREKLDGLAGSASRQETEAREARLRIGRALDELGRDESRVARLLAEITPRYEEAKQRLEELERPLLRAWGQIPPLPADKPRVTRDVVDALREAGHLASIWVEAERAFAAQERDLQDRMREREDLTFQIAQLKGRIGTMNAESDIDLSSIREETTRLDSQLRKLLDELMRDVEPVYHHFASIPGFEDKVHQAG